MTQCGTDDATEGGTGRCSWCAALHVLGLETVVSDDEIRSTYRLLAQVWHPDRFQTNQKLRDAAEEKLKEINRAYQYLTSPKGRSERCSGGSRRTPPEQAATASSPPQPASEPREPERQSQPAAPPQSRVWLVAHSGILLQYGVILVCASLAGLLVLKRLDSYLDSNPQTSKYYGETKARVAAEAEEALGGIWDTVRQNLRLLPSRSAQSSANGSQGRLQAETPHGASGHLVRPAEPATMKIRPYITADLTKQEVEEIQGPPTEATENKLVYQRSELYFRSNHLIGWKIDPSSPLRVKLWPDSVVDPRLKTFTLGSSKSEVLAVQGTPSLFSGNRFGYGRSEVFFENNQVIGWRNDPATIPLLVTNQ